jgi:hypothetical protein
MEAFVEAPSEAKVYKCTKRQLWEVAEHYGLEGLRKDLGKEELQELIRSGLVEKSIIRTQTEPSTPNDSDEDSRSGDKDLSFEQKMALRRFEAEQRHLDRDREADLERRRLDREVALEIEKLKRDTDIERLRTESELQREKFRLIAEGKMRGTEAGESRSGAEGNLSNMIRFLPRFNDRDPDIFFSLFEGIADQREWDDAERTLLLQAVLEGRAQDAYVALSVVERRCYKSVKAAVLRAYEQVPEFYRQHFRNWRKGDRQTYSEVARDLVGYFNRWCSAVNVVTLEQLSDLVVLEQFKNIVPEHLAAFINEHKVKTAAEAAVLSDEYALTHRPVIHDRDERRTTRYNGKDSGQAVFRQDSSYRNKADNERCHYCDESGHWKRYCPSLRNRLPTKSNFSGPSSANGVGCVANVRQSNPTPNVEQVNKDPTEGTASKGGSGCGVLDLPGEGQCFSESAIGHVGEGYGPFITDGFVSLVGSSEKRPVKILRDTGATETFVVESVLPFSGQSSTGNVVLIRGMGVQTMSVPLHHIELSSDLVKGNVVVGVCPALPVLGVHIILGNKLAGDRVWPKG